MIIVESLKKNEDRLNEAAFIEDNNILLCFADARVGGEHIFCKTVHEY